MEKGKRRFDHRRSSVLLKSDKFLLLLKEGWGPELACSKLDMKWEKAKVYLLTNQDVQKAVCDYKLRIELRKIRTGIVF